MSCAALPRDHAGCRSGNGLGEDQPLGQVAQVVEGGQGFQGARAGQGRESLGSSQGGHRGSGRG